MNEYSELDSKTLVELKVALKGSMTYVPEGTGLYRTGQRVLAKLEEEVSKRNYAAFDKWMSDVDKAVSALTYGLSTDDLPDFRYNDAFKDGYTPTQAAIEMLLENGYPLK